MNHNLHQAQSHEVTRAWQSQRNEINHSIDFVLPLFICNDDDAIETISSMPDVFRYGCNRAIDYLEPLINKYGLKSVLLFPVPSKSDIESAKAKIVRGGIIEVDDSDQDTSSPSLNSSCSSQASSPSLTNSSDTDAETPKSLKDSAYSKPKLLKPKAPGSAKSNPFFTANEEEDHLLECEQVPNAEETIIDSKSEISAKLLEMELVKSLALDSKYNPVLRLLPRLKEYFPQLLAMCDVCLCAFTSTGHCCIFEDQLKSENVQKSKEQTKLPRMSNKLTCKYLAQLSIEYVTRGCDVIAPSDMMDGRIRAIRKRLDDEKFDDISIMSYSAKFASAFYGPFRQATNNTPEFGDRRAYQLPPGSRTLAIRAVARDIKEGADFIMVKPGVAYLDVIRDIKNNHPDVPIAVYQVSGEYSMLKLAAKEGILDYKRAVNESITSFRRAGASIMISYFTPEFLKGEL